MIPEERAARAVDELEHAILDLLSSVPNGLGNAEIAKELGLFSPPGTEQRNRLTYSLLQRLEESGRVTKSSGPRPVYKVA